MAIGEQEAGGAVIECGSVPVCGGMASGAFGERESVWRACVRRVVGLLPGGEVAARVAAVGGRDLKVVIVVDVARETGHVGVARGKQEACLGVVEFCAKPAIEIMAIGALGDGEFLR